MEAGVNYIYICFYLLRFVGIFSTYVLQMCVSCIRFVYDHVVISVSVVIRVVVTQVIQGFLT